MPGDAQQPGGRGDEGPSGLPGRSCGNGSVYSRRKRTRQREFLVSAGVYTENVQFPEIRGTSAASTVTFRRDPADDGDVFLQGVGTIPTITIDKADWLIFDYINLSNSAPAYTSLYLTNGATNNSFANASISAASLTQLSSYAIHLNGGANSANILTNLTIGGAYSGIRLEGLGSKFDSANVIQDCRISNCRYGIRADYQSDLVISGNIIESGFAGAPLSCYGIYIGSHAAAQNCSIERNRFAGTPISADIGAIYSAAANRSVLITNNFFSGLSALTGGSVNAIKFASGSGLCYFNSFWLGESE